MESNDQSLILSNFASFTKFRMEIVSSVLEPIRVGDMMFLNDICFQFLTHLESRCYLWISLNEKVLQFKAFTFQTFHSTPGLHQTILYCARVGSQERDPAASLSGRLADYSVVKPLPARKSQGPLLSSSGPRDCHYLGEIRPQANQQGSVSRNC